MGKFWTKRVKLVDNVPTRTKADILAQTSILRQGSGIQRQRDLRALRVEFLETLISL